MAPKRVRDAPPAANASRKRVKRDTDDKATTAPKANATTTKAKTKLSNSKPRSAPDAKTKATARKPVKTAAQTKQAASKSAPSKEPSYYTTLPSDALRVFACGDGSAGELGFGNVRGAIEVKIPKPLKNWTDAVKVVAGGMHGAGINKAGKVLTWGGNDEFALGRPTPEPENNDEDDDAPGLNRNEATPTVIPTLPENETFTQVAAGDSCTFALTNTGYVYGWGTFRNANGAYRFTYTKGEDLQKFQQTPMQIPGLESIVSIDVGTNFALALDASGKVWGWGPNEQGEIGSVHRESRTQPKDSQFVPQRAAFPASVKIASIHAGSYHAFAIDTKGTVWAWGLNNFGQTGIPSGAGSNNPIINPPRRVESLAGKNVVTLAGAAHHSLALTADGTVLVFGRIDGFRTGLPDSFFASSHPSDEVMLDEYDKPRILLRPTKLDLPPVAAIAAGTDHSIAVARSGKLYTWGLNATMQCGTGNDDDVPVATLLTAKTVAEVAFVGAAAGGQSSMFFAKA